MSDPRPVFIADTCIGGLSVVKSIWSSGSTADAFFLADYAINPLGVKSDSDIAEVVARWLEFAEEHSDTLVIACNTLSVRYHKLVRSDMPRSRLSRIVSMVDCIEAMVKSEADRLANRKVLVIGTEFTANQELYPEILDTVPGVRVDTVAATELERMIARFEPWQGELGSILAGEPGQAIENADMVVLACTCFPIVQAELESLFPGVVFLDPGAYCPGILDENSSSQHRRLCIKATGDVVSTKSVLEFAETYLGNSAVVSC